MAPLVIDDLLCLLLAWKGGDSDSDSGVGMRPGRLGQRMPARGLGEAGARSNSWCYCQDGSSWLNVSNILEQRGICIAAEWDAMLGCQGADRACG